MTPPPQPTVTSPVTSDDNELHNINAEELFCSALLVDPYTAIKLAAEVSPPEFYHARPRAVAEAVFACLSASPPMEITRATVIANLTTIGKWGSTVTEMYLDDLDDRGTSKVIEAARTHAVIIRQRFVARSGLKELDKARQDIIAAPGAAEARLDALVKDVLTIRATHGSARRDSSSKAIMENRIVTDQLPIQTKIAWIDKAFGGFRAARLIGIQGRYKGRKTTLARNLVLTPVVKQIGVSWFTLDNSRDEANDGLVSLLATSFMIKAGADEEEMNLSDEWLPPGHRTPAQNEAILHAEQVLRESSFRAYDAKDGIRNLDILEATIRRDCAYGARIIVCDFAQKFRGSRMRMSQFEHFEATIDLFQNMVSDYAVTGIMLAQRNEAKNREEGAADGDDEENEGSAGTKYGGALAAAADYLIDTKKTAPALMRATMNYSRRTDESSVVFELNRSSGLILNPQQV